MNQAEVEMTAALSENDAVRDALLASKKVFGVGGIRWFKGGFSSIKARIVRKKRKEVDVFCAVGGMRMAVFGDAYTVRRSGAEAALYKAMLVRFVKEGLGKDKITYEVYRGYYKGYDKTTVKVENASVYHLENTIINWNDSSRRKWDQVRDAFTKAIKA